MKMVIYHIVAVSLIQLCFVSLLGAEDIQPTIPPNGTTIVPPTTPPTPPTPPTTSTTTTPSTSTTSPTTPSTPSTSTTPPTTPTTTSTPSTTTVTPPTTPTTAPPTTTTTTAKPTPAPTPKPEPDRKFDGPSFIGGMILTMGLMAIAFVSWKFYKTRTDSNYHTL